MKKLIPSLLLSFILVNAGCKDLTCISCIAQKKSTGEIIETRATCDKDSDYTDGFASGFKSRYATQTDSINVLCK